MIYVFDSDALIDLFKHFYLNRFPSLWEKFDLLAKEGKIISVREVYNEIGGRGDRLSQWAKKTQNLFQQSSPEELVFVTEIFKVRHFQSLIHEKERLQGKPVADPFVIARAKIFHGCVITQENKKPNAAKIPNVCERFNIDCSNLEGFMEREGWTF
ncbi:MAG: DUF4411 family protein [Dehalococcoidia bacterium]|nr:DUF4411 family protein [Dehalococcoidia bacterium]